jgi:membrane protease YdiL (CAAX protease family)
MRTKKRYDPNTFNAAHAGAAYLAYWAMMAVATILWAVVYVVATGAEGTDDYSPWLCLNSAFVTVGLVILTLIFCAVAKSKTVNGGGFLARKGCGMEMLMAAVLVCGMATLFSPLAESFANDFQWMQKYIGIATSGDMPIQTNGWSLLYVLICVPILPAIFEELFFRGVIMRGLTQLGKPAAVILSALMFALAHGNTDQFIYQFLLGLVIGCLVLETKNLVVGMVAHFTNNFFAIVMEFVLGDLSGTGASALAYQKVMEIMYYLIGAVCLVAGILYFGKRMLYTQKHPNKSREDITATFVAEDLVSGQILAEKPWFECGELNEKGAEAQVYLVGEKKKRKLNCRAKTSKALILIGLGLAVGITVEMLSFFGIL